MPPTDPTPAPGHSRFGRRGSTRSMPLVLLAAAGILLLARIGLAIFERVEREPRPDLVEWRAPGAEALAEAEQRGKPVLYDFAADWCAPCHAMQDEIFADARMAAQINATFVPVRVVDRQREDGRNAPEVDALERMYRIQVFPTLVVASADGSRHDAQEGYPGKVETAQWLAIAPFKAGVGKPRKK